MTARRVKRTPTPKATGTALRTTPGGRASATPKNQCRRLNAETRGRRAPAQAGDRTPAKTQMAHQDTAPRTGRRHPLDWPRLAQRSNAPAQAEETGGRELQADEIRHTRANAEAATGSRCDAIQTGFHAQRAWGSAFSKSRPLRSLNGSGRVSSDRQRPGLSRHAGGGSTSREQFAATFPRVPLLYCQSNMVASRSGLGNRPL